MFQDLYGFILRLLCVVYTLQMEKNRILTKTLCFFRFLMIDKEYRMPTQTIVLKSWLGFLKQRTPTPRYPRITSSYDQCNKIIRDASKIQEFFKTSLELFIDLD